MRNQPGGRMVGVMVALAAALVAWPAAALAQDDGTPPAKTATAPAKTTPAKPAPPDLTDKLTAQMNVISEKLSNLQTEELQTGINEEKTVSAAAANVDDVKGAADLLFKGKTAKGLPEYRKALLTAAGQWQQLYVKLQPIAGLGKALERDRPKASPEIQTLIDQLLGRIQEKGRNIQDKMGELFEKAGDYKQAVACYVALYQGIPEAKRAGEKKLLEKIVTLYTALADAKDALVCYKLLQAALPENERNKDVGMGLRICDVLEKANDYRTELQLLQALHAANPGDKGVSDRIAKIEKKAGVPAGTAGTVVPATGGDVGKYAQIR